MKLMSTKFIVGSAVLAVAGCCAAPVLAEVVYMETGAGVTPGNPDTQITMLIGPPSSPFASAFSAADFVAAQNGPHPLVVDVPNANYPTPGMPYSHPVFGNHPEPLCSIAGNYIAASGAGDPYLNGTDPNVTNNGGHTALYCIEFVLTQDVVCAELEISFLGDNGLGYDPSGSDPNIPPGLGAYNAGLWINEQPLSGTVLCSFGSAGFINPEPDDDPLDLQVGARLLRDVSTLVSPGVNRLYVYNVDFLTHSAALFCATVRTNANVTPSGNSPAFDAPSPCAANVSSTVGTPVMFTVQSSDLDSGDVVAISAGTLPPGVVLNMTNAVGNPAWIDVTWTPQVGQFSGQVAFTATDLTCQATQCVTTLTLDCTTVPGLAVPYGCGANPPDSLVIPSVSAPVPVVGGSITFVVDNTVGTQPSGSPCFLIVAAAPDAAYPCGTPGPSSRWGMYPGPTNTGEILVDLSSPFVFAGMQPTPATFQLPVPNDPNLIGIKAYVQGFVTTQMGSIWYGPTSALELTVGGCKF